MAAVSTNPIAVYANKHVIMLSSVMRMVFIDQRQNVGRVAATESVVAEIVMTREHAQLLADEIIRSLAPVAEVRDERTSEANTKWSKSGETF